MDPKIVNTEEDILNPMADTRNYSAGNEDGKIKDMENQPEREEDEAGFDEHAFDEPEIKDDERLPDEIADPAEDDSEDEMP